MGRRWVRPGSASRSALPPFSTPRLVLRASACCAVSLLPPPREKWTSQRNPFRAERAACVRLRLRDCGASADLILFLGCVCLLQGCEWLACASRIVWVQSGGNSDIWGEPNIRVLVVGGPSGTTVTAPLLLKALAHLSPGSSPALAPDGVVGPLLVGVRRESSSCAHVLVGAPSWVLTFERFGACLARRGRLA